MARRRWTAATAGLVAAGLLAAGAAEAQRAPSIPEADPETAEGDAVRTRRSSATDDGSESEQTEPSRAGSDIREFEDVRVDRRRPSELPPPMETELPEVLRGATRPTGAPPSREELRSTASHVRERTYRLLAVHQLETPEEEAATVRTGHAVLAGAPSSERSFLVTTFFWLEDARAIYLVPRTQSPEPAPRGGRPEAPRRSLDEVSTGVDGRQGVASGWLDEHREDLVSARLFRPDEDRNLVAVVPSEPDRLSRPPSGLALFDIDAESPTWLYGYSSTVEPALQSARLTGSPREDRALSYYLQTSFTPSYGAPIVSVDGELLVLTAFPEPDASGTTLVIPPEPLATYVSQLRDAAGE